MMPNPMGFMNPMNYGMFMKPGEQNMFMMNSKLNINNFYNFPLSIFNEIF